MIRDDGEAYRRKAVFCENVHRLFTYAEAAAIVIMTKVKRKDDGNANNEERKLLLWFDDVFGDGHLHDCLQFIHKRFNR